LKLSFPISLDRVPGSDQMLVIVQAKPYGPAEVLRFNDEPSVSSAEGILTMPNNGTAYGITFHPRFAENGYLYIGWNAGTQGSKQTMVTRYTMNDSRTKIDPESAVNIIAWDSNGHNGGDLEFGLDGMLYVTSGDGTSDSDTNLRGQDLTQLTSKVLRIDVDHPGGTGFGGTGFGGTGFQPVTHGQDGRATPAKNYSIPPDNPFVGVKGVVPETWAYGLRNPWRIAVDPRTGHIWVGNNGQDLWEQVYFVRKGDNFGWSVYEGSHVFYANRQMGPQPLTPPAAEHHHSEARSMTGGVVYYGEKLPELQGAYIYGDHSTGRIWGIKHDGTRVTWHKLLADTTFNITGFAIDHRGELLVADHRGTGEGGYYYLEPTPHDATPAAFPRKLSDSGLFALRTPHAPGEERAASDGAIERSAARKDFITRSVMSTVPGVIPYSVNSPLWSDGAYKERYLAIPEQAASEAKIDLGTKTGWNLPDKTVLIKSFALETVAGDPTSRRWIETRFLTKQGGEWAGYSYIWNDDQTDAELVAAEGLDREFEIRSPDSKPAAQSIHKQKWRFPSRVECMVCHSRAAGFVLGPSTAQMNREHDNGGVVENQLHVLDQLGLIKRPGDKPVDPARYPHLTNPYDESQPLEARARSYLHANCSICHTSAGGGNAQINLQDGGPLKRLNAIDVAPLHHKFGLDEARIIAPGHPERSVLLHRMAHRGKGSGQMPQLATDLVDQAAVTMMEAWIRTLQPLEP
jgi:uncharacterized repeat protein (TIGR03806 family)